MLARHDMKSGVSVPKLTSMCQPASPGSSADGNRTGKVPIAAGRRQRPLSDQLIERGVQPWRVGGLDERGLGEHPQSDDGLRPGGGSSGAPGRLPEHRSGRIRQRARERVVDSYESVRDELFDLRRFEPRHDGRDVFNGLPSSHESACPRHPATISACVSTSSSTGFIINLELSTQK